MSGFVYFIASGDRVKIGYSEDPAKRLSKINADSPMPCELLGYVSADDFPESELHARFAAVRLHSEWFALTSEIRSFIDAASIAKPAPKNSVGKIISSRFDRIDLTDASPLKRWRVEQKLGQQDAAKLVGITHSAFNQWETGKIRIAAVRCQAVAALTGISVHVLRPDIYGPAPDVLPQHQSSKVTG